MMMRSWMTQYSEPGRVGSAKDDGSDSFPLHKQPTSLRLDLLIYMLMMNITTKIEGKIMAMMMTTMVMMMTTLWCLCFSIRQSVQWELPQGFFSRLCIAHQTKGTNADARRSTNKIQGTQIQTNKKVQKTMRWGTQCPQVSKSQKLVNTKTDAHKGRPLKIEGRRAMAKTSNWFNHNYQLHTKCRAPKIILLNQTSRVGTDSTRAYYKRDLSDLLEVHIHIK